MHTIQKTSEEFSPVRSIGMAGAISLHLAAALLLLGGAGEVEAPLAMESPFIAEWILPDKPVEVQPVPPTPRPPERPQTVVTPSPPAPPPPLQIEAAWSEPVAAPIEVQTAPVELAVAEPARPSPPAEPSQLEYAQMPPPPRYPSPAVRANQQGTVLLRIHVDSDGVPTHAAVERSSGHRILDRAAVEYAMRKLRFKPAQREGRAVAAIAQVPVAFTLPGRS
ncbi:energy transducer TonB [Aquimonas sp.]|uniref:energy transducer TonB n=1 Tax=Aquimonas sp. TaxID=1872588 RepID=UPI0037C0212E